MAKKDDKIISINSTDDINLSLEELANALHAEPELIIEMVEYEMISPHGKTPQTWRFNSICLKRAKKAVEFRKDLEINMVGIAFALDLLDQIETLENRLKLLEKLTH